MSEFFDHLALFLQPSHLVIAVIAGLAAIALALVLAKVCEFFSCGIGDGKRAETFLRDWRKDHPDGAQSGRAVPRSAAEKAVTTALVLLEQRKPQIEIEERVDLQVNADLNRLSKGLPALKAIAWAAPLVGVCGTALGIIQVFRTPSTADDVLTAFSSIAAGLAVSVLVLLSVSWLKSRLEAERATIKVLTASLLTE